MRALIIIFLFLISCEKNQVVEKYNIIEEGYGSIRAGKFEHISKSIIYIDSSNREVFSKEIIRGHKFFIKTTEYKDGIVSGSTFSYYNNHLTEYSSRKKVYIHNSDYTREKVVDSDEKNINKFELIRYYYKDSVVEYKNDDTVKVKTKKLYKFFTKDNEVLPLIEVLYNNLVNKDSVVYEYKNGNLYKEAVYEIERKYALDSLRGEYVGKLEYVKKLDWVYTYDIKENLVSKENSLNHFYDSYYVYKYDKKGRWIEKRDYSQYQRDSLGNQLVIDKDVLISLGDCYITTRDYSG